MQRNVQSPFSPITSLFPPSPHTLTTYIQVMIMKDHRHDNIVEFYDSYLVEDELWVVMEYLDGGALTSVVQHTRCVWVGRYNSGRGDWRRKRGARVCTHNLCACVRKVRGCDQVFGEDVYCKDEKGVLIVTVSLSSRVTHTVSQKSRLQPCVRAA